MSRLKGKSVFITGAGSGIGREAAQLFAREGASILIAERNVSAGEETARLVTSQGGIAKFVETDVTQEESVRHAIAQAMSAFKKIDVLYNNAGGSSTADNRVTDCSNEEFWLRISIDLFGTWLVCKHGIATMMETGGGSVINSTSVFALIGTRAKDAYTAATGGVSALTRSMAVEYAPYKIRVNALAPGLTGTDRALKLLAEQPEVIKGMLDRQLLGIVKPSHIASTALYLASDDSDGTTGQIISVDGGFAIS